MISKKLIQRIIGRFDRQYLISFKDSGNPARADSSNRHVKDTLDHWGSFFIQNPVIFVLQVSAVAVGRLADVFAAGATGFHDRTDLFACIFGIKIVKKITERGKIVISTFTVHAIINSNEPDIVAGKNDFCVLLLRIQIPAVNQFFR